MALQMFEEEDVKTVAGFINGWWPGLEDGMSWPDNDNDPVLLAAQRLLNRIVEIHG